MPQEMYSEQEMDERYEEGIQYALDNLEDYYDEIANTAIDQLNEQYLMRDEYEWANDAVAAHLCLLDTATLKFLASHIVEELETRI